MKLFGKQNGKTTISPRKVLAIRRAHAEALVRGKGMLTWGWYSREAERRGISLPYLTQIIHGSRRTEG